MFLPYKISLFVWLLLLNHVSTKDNLVRCRGVSNNDQNCIGACGMNEEDVGHLFMTCDFYGTLGWFQAALDFLWQLMVIYMTILFSSVA